MRGGGGFKRELWVDWDMFGDDGNGGRSPRMASRVLAWVCWLPIGIEDKGILFQITGMEVEEMRR